LIIHPQITEAWEIHNVRTQVSLGSVGALVEGRHENPFEILGPHELVEGQRRLMTVRAYLPDSNQAWIVDKQHGEVRRMRRIHPAGLFEAICPPADEAPGAKYMLRANHVNGAESTVHDPYAFPPLLTEYDLYLLGEGQHWNAYDKLGSQLRTVDGITGVNFAVWAPNATSVSVVGDFNGWDSRKHQMRKHIPSGIWELFIPDLKEGAIYKYRVNHHGAVSDKCDPYGFAAELPPKTASMVSDLSRYQWQDNSWMTERAKGNNLDKPISIYEVHLGSWQKEAGRSHGWLDYRTLAHRLVDYCEKQGFTHLELMPVSEHPFTGSWGYQTVGYFAVTSRYGSPQDFMYFVDYCHQHNIGVIIDWVPAHFPKDGHGLRQFDGSALYEHADPRQGEHPDWGTMIFNYDRTEVRNFLMANALFWLDKYHIDGLRVDAVASMLYLDYSRKEGEWVPNMYGGNENLSAVSLLKQFNELVHAKHPGTLTIAEESTAFSGVSRPTYLGGLGFSLKWNMGWMNDTLEFMQHESIHRKYHHDRLTFSLIYAFSENFVLPLSHDEVVHGKGSLAAQMPGDLWQKFANLRLLYSYMWTHPGKKLLFMGGEIAQWNEWNHDNSIEWDLLQFETHRGVQNCMADLNRVYRQQASLHQIDFDPAGFQWIDCNNHDDSTLSYIRLAKNPEDFLVVAHNFTPVPRLTHRLGVPALCGYQEIFNSDSTYYGGSNIGNGMGIQATSHACHGRPYSIELTLPPLATVILKPMK
jgi:1,4-alpha-glucan branching enzyme